MSVRHPDFLATFSHRLTQVKFIILEVAVFIGFVLWVADKVRHDIWPKPEPTVRAAPSKGKSRPESSDEPPRRQVNPPPNEYL